MSAPARARLVPLLHALVLAAGLVAVPAAAMAADAPTAVPATPAEPAASGGATAAPAQAPSPAAPAAPGVARPNAEDPALEQRLIAVTKELRCLVCQNESIADSHASLAVDMRNEIREQLKSGMSERQVIDFMVARYGNFVRFRPPLDWTTIALWFGPGLLMAIGLGLLVGQLRHRRTLAAARAMPELSEAQRAALATLASGPEGNETLKDRNTDRMVDR